MKQAIAWMKLNPLTVISATIILLSLGFIAYVWLFMSPSLQSEMSEREPEIRKIRQYQQQNISVPPENADDPPRNLAGVTINEKTVEKLETIYANLKGQNTQIHRVAVEINDRSSQQLVEDLFPETPSTLLFGARGNYRSAVASLLADAAAAANLATSTGIVQPYLNAGLPLDKDTLQAKLDQKYAEASSDGMTEAQAEDFREEQQILLMNSLIDHARTINIYADPVLGDPTSPNPAFPLQVATLGQTTASPDPATVWEGQLQLWILQDIIAAIALANDVLNEKDHGMTASGEPIPSSVLNAPVKRLLGVEVLPGYVGLHTMGGVDTTGSSSNTRSASTSGAGYAPPPPGAISNANVLPPLFYFSPTGRASNSLFDVRHVRLSVFADFQKLPDLFNAISSVNLMTIIDARYESLDEYGDEGLANLYLFGQGDIVKADFIIETIWLREWTVPLMPPVVREYLAVPENAASSL
jgi:hypothetical protein